MKYILNWNDEYLSMALIAGPVDEKTSKSLLKEIVLKRLVELNVADDQEEAQEIYAKAASEDAEENGEVYDSLSLSEFGASICYGDCNEDRYEIVEYDPCQSEDEEPSDVTEYHFKNNWHHFKNNWSWDEIKGVVKAFEDWEPSHLEIIRGERAGTIHSTYGLTYISLDYQAMVINKNVKAVLSKERDYMFDWLGLTACGEVVAAFYDMERNVKQVLIGRI